MDGARHLDALAIDPAHAVRQQGQERLRYVTNLGARPAGFEYVGAADGRAHHLPMAGAHAANTSAAYVRAALAGLGIIQVPEPGVRAHLQAKRLIELLPRWRAAPMPVSLLYAHRRQLPRRVQVCMNWLAGLTMSRLQG